MASIGLTIPAIAVASIWLDGPLLLGLGPARSWCCSRSPRSSARSPSVPGSAMVLGGVVHLVIFAAFLFVAVIP